VNSVAYPRRVSPGLSTTLAAWVGLAWATASLVAPSPAPAAERSRGLVPCTPEEVPATLVAGRATATLGIAARDQDPERPPEGWCGETAIQEAMLYHGVYFPQKLINAAGRPRHPDLYSDDVPVALKNLRMEVTVWPAGNGRPGLDGFLGWVRGRIDAGVPVLCGVKINPTRHPEWGLDHFVLAVGRSGDSVLFNTTWGNRVMRTGEQLRSTTEKGFAFENRYRSYYGLAISGPSGRGEGAVPVRLFVQKESRERLSVILKCEGLEPGRRYAIDRRTSYEEQVSAPVQVFTARGIDAGFLDTIERARPAIYGCREQ
jgi:hypothetical protein